MQIHVNRVGAGWALVCVQGGGVSLGNHTWARRQVEGTSHLGGQEAPAVALPSSAVALRLVAVLQGGCQVARQAVLPSWVVAGHLAARHLAAPFSAGHAARRRAAPFLEHLAASQVAVACPLDRVGPSAGRAGHPGARLDGHRGGRLGEHPSGACRAVASQAVRQEARQEASHPGGRAGRAWRQEEASPLGARLAAGRPSARSLGVASQVAGRLEASCQAGGAYPAVGHPEAPCRAAASPAVARRVGQAGQVASQAAVVGVAHHSVHTQSAGRT